MATITYSYSDFTFPETERVLEKLAASMVERMKTKLAEPRDPNGWHTNASGTLSGSIKYIPDKLPELEIDISLEDYWKYVEYGTRPHWTGVKRLLDWIKIKPVIPEVRNGKKAPTIEQLSYMIQRKIAREVTPAQQFFWNSVDETTTEFQAEIEAALEKDMDRNIDSIILQLKGL